MENLRENKKPVWSRLLLSALIGLCGAAGLYFTPLLLLLPAFLALCAQWGGACGAIAFGLSGLGVGLLGGERGLYALAMFLPAAAVLTVGMRAKAPWRSLAAGNIFCFATARYLDFCLPSLLAGAEPFAEVRQIVTAAVGYYEEMAAVFQYSLPEGLGAVLVDMTPEFTVGVILVSAMAFGFADVLIARALCKGQAALRPMAPFWDWQLSRDELIGTGILGAGAVAVQLMSLKYAGAICAAIELIVLGELALNGFCYSDFISRARGQGAGRRALKYLLYALFIPYSVFALAVMGLIESLLGLRRRFKIMPKE